MKKIIIGIVSRPIHSNSDRNMLGVYETYLRSVIKAGGIPLIISPTANIEYEKYNKHVELTESELENLEHVLNLCDGIIMPGGEEPFKYDYCVLKYAIKNDIPILGICLGMQIMCSLNDYNLVPAYNHYLTNHKIYLEDSKLKEIFNRDILYVNSRHKEQAKNSGIYKVVARSDDEIIEAVELDTNTFNVGVQWHPEDMKEQQILFDEFVKTIKKQKK